jgi:hypothetical protein
MEREMPVEESINLISPPIYDQKDYYGLVMRSVPGIVHSFHVRGSRCMERRHPRTDITLKVLTEDTVRFLRQVKKEDKL